MTASARAPALTTLGCRLNSVESDAMANLVTAGGSGQVAAIINTCAVTADAMRRSRQAVRRALREAPDGTVAVTGCAAEIARADFMNLSSRVRLVPNASKTDPAAWRALGLTTAGDSARGLPSHARRHTRGFVAVQTGCDHDCTFCIIPAGRGRSRSVPIADVIAQVRAGVAAGDKDVVLTGVDLTAWGSDLGEPRLGDLVRAILRAVPDLPRLRLSSLDCVEADKTLLDALADEERLMPHLHLSLQAGHDLTLKRMKRRHSRADAVHFCEAVRRLRPDIVFGADLIAGFPTETEAMFAGTLALLDDCGLTHLHVFPYSPRPGTPAARMPSVPSAAITARAARLRNEGARRLRSHLDRQVGRVLPVLVERGAAGRAPDFTSVAVPAELAPGRIVPVAIRGHDGARLVGDVAVAMSD